MNESQCASSSDVSVARQELPADALVRSIPETNPFQELDTLPLATPTQIATERLPSRSPRLEAIAPWRSPGTIGSVLAASLQARWLAYRKQLRTCQRSFSEETVHELRVATRRLIAQLILIECGVPDMTARDARRLLKRRLKALGELRDTHVQRLLIERHVARYPELILVRDWLQRRERWLERTVAAKVKAYKTRRLKNWVSRLGWRLTLNSTDPRRSDRVATTVKRATTRAFHDAVNRWRAIDPATPSTVHCTRIAIKKFRYMAELLAPEFTGLSKADLRALAHCQRRMGMIQDLEVAERYVARFVDEHRGLEELLRPFLRYLAGTRARRLHSLLKSADNPFAVWPPTPARSNGHVALPARNAA